MVNQTTFEWAECAHPSVEVVPEKRGPHHARRICSKCRKFLGWVPHPETVERQRKNAIILTALAKIDNLSEWERGFVRDLITHTKLSPRQQEQLLLLKEKYNV